MIKNLLNFYEDFRKNIFKCIEHVIYDCKDYDDTMK